MHTILRHLKMRVSMMKLLKGNRFLKKGLVSGRRMGQIGWLLKITIHVL